MKLGDVERLRGELAEFVGDVFGSLPRRDQRRWGACYLRGLMLDGRRKSIQPMAERLPDGNMQALQQFVNQSPWDPLPVRQRIARRLSDAVMPEVWVIDDVSFPKCGRASAGVARQCCGAFGKRANCQVAVSVHAATDAASCPLDWQLYLPREWTDDPGRCHQAGIPDDIVHQEKWRLALGLLDNVTGWGLTAPVVVADVGYGVSTPFRHGLQERGLSQDGVLPTSTVPVEWPAGVDAPTGYWISNLSPETPTAQLVRWAKMRWRIEHDYRELKHGLSLDHFEGRTWRGWHHHVTLVTAAQAFLTLRRLDPKVHTLA
ncbi:IS701 family transposase [Streptomyces griseolus]|uniref:IS701 family transposase n=1 Tax=Streptomyces griseolus TaxID=1909 RepID=UPI002242FA77|nr:IS701 family transposase [Streptomyces griseolus]MCW8217071.1 IS701 family transposase [Streptomyces griseolus]